MKKRTYEHVKVIIAFGEAFGIISSESHDYNDHITPSALLLHLFHLNKISKSISLIEDFRKK